MCSRTLQEIEKVESEGVKVPEQPFRLQQILMNKSQLIRMNISLASVELEINPFSD